MDEEHIIIRRQGVLGRLTLNRPGALNALTQSMCETVLRTLSEWEGDPAIAAIVVGLCQFAVRAYNENNGNEKVRKVIQTVLQFVDTLIQHSKVFFADPVTVPVQQQSAKRAKVA